MLANWRERPPDETPPVFLDVRYERVREAGQRVDCAVRVAVDISADGKRRVLGVSVALSEAEIHWRAFLDSLIRRGLQGVKLIVSDPVLPISVADRLGDLFICAWIRVCYFQFSRPPLWRLVERGNFLDCLPPTGSAR